MSKGLGQDAWAKTIESVSDPRDRAFARELLGGVTRWRGLLDEYISAFSHRPLGTLSRSLLWTLRIGCYQMLFLGMPPYTLDAVVGLLRTKGERGYCNGVLREMSRAAGHVHLPSVDDEPVPYMTKRWSVPPWIAKLFLERFGLTHALRLLRAANSRPQLTLRANTTRTSAGKLLKKLENRGYQAARGQLSVSVKVRGSGFVSALPGFEEGLFSVQDEAAMLVSFTVDPSPGQRVWDACAAPGGKTTHMAELMGGEGTVLATEVDPDRAGMVKKAGDRLGLRNIRVEVRDSSSGSVGPAFHRILVDAPCSGLGVLDKNADLRWNRRPSDVRALSSIQRRLLEGVCPSLLPGGVLVYSTCTLTKEENEGVFLNFLSDHPEFVPDDPLPFMEKAGLDVAGGPFDGPGYRYLLPHIHNTSGFFVGRAVKKEGI